MNVFKKLMQLVSGSASAELDKSSKKQTADPVAFKSKLNQQSHKLESVSKSEPTAKSSFIGVKKARIQAAELDVSIEYDEKVFKQPGEKSKNTKADGLGVRFTQGSDKESSDNGVITNGEKPKSIFPKVPKEVSLFVKNSSNDPNSKTDKNDLHIASNGNETHISADERSSIFPHKQQDADTNDSSSLTKKEKPAEENSTIFGKTAKKENENSSTAAGDAKTSKSAQKVDPRNSFINGIHGENSKTISKDEINLPKVENTLDTIVKTEKEDLIEDQKAQKEGKTVDATKSNAQKAQPTSLKKPTITGSHTVIKTDAVRVEPKKSTKVGESKITNADEETVNSKSSKVENNTAKVDLKVDPEKGNINTQKTVQTQLFETPKVKEQNTNASNMGGKSTVKQGAESADRGQSNENSTNSNKSVNSANSVKADNKTVDQKANIKTDVADLGTTKSGTLKSTVDSRADRSIKTTSTHQNQDKTTSKTINSDILNLKTGGAKPEIKPKVSAQNSPKAETVSASSTKASNEIKGQVEGQSVKSEVVSSTKTEGAKPEIKPKVSAQNSPKAETVSASSTKASNEIKGQVEGQSVKSEVVSSTKTEGAKPEIKPKVSAQNSPKAETVTASSTKASNEIKGQIEGQSVKSEVVSSTKTEGAKPEIKPKVSAQNSPKAETVSASSTKASNEIKGQVEGQSVKSEVVSSTKTEGAKPEISALNTQKTTDTLARNATTTHTDKPGNDTGLKASENQRTSTQSKTDPAKTEITATKVHLADRKETAHPDGHVRINTKNQESTVQTDAKLSEVKGEVKSELTSVNQAKTVGVTEEKKLDIPEKASLKTAQTGGSTKTEANTHEPLKAESKPVKVEIPDTDTAKETPKGEQTPRSASQSKIKFTESQTSEDIATDSSKSVKKNDTQQKKQTIKSADESKTESTVNVKENASTISATKESDVKTNGVDIQKTGEKVPDFDNKTAKSTNEQTQVKGNSQFELDFDTPETPDITPLNKTVEASSSAEMPIKSTNPIAVAETEVKVPELKVGMAATIKPPVSTSKPESEFAKTEILNNTKVISKPTETVNSDSQNQVESGDKTTKVTEKSSEVKSVKSFGRSVQTNPEAAAKNTNVDKVEIKNAPQNTSEVKVNTKESVKESVVKPEVQQVGNNSAVDKTNETIQSKTADTPKIKTSDKQEMSFSGNNDQKGSDEPTGQGQTKTDVKISKISKEDITKPEIPALQSMKTGSSESAAKGAENLKAKSVQENSSQAQAQNQAELINQSESASERIAKELKIDIPLSGNTLQKEFPARVVSVAQPLLQQSMKGEQQFWQKHRFVFESGKAITVAIKKGEGTLHIQLNGGNQEVNKLLQQHAQEIKQSLQEQFDLEVDIEFGENQFNDSLAEQNKGSGSGSGITTENLTGLREAQQSERQQADTNGQRTAKSLDVTENEWTA